MVTPDVRLAETAVDAIHDLREGPFTGENVAAYLDLKHIF
jgi:hypothetical protein